jgi:hypothetical protein
MFVEQLRRTISASPRVELARVAQLLWKAYAAGQVSEDQASELSDLIEARRALPPAPKPVQRRLIGSRPRTPASLERRRRWAASGALPPALASRFTLAETAVLAVVAAEHVKHGRCTLVIDHIAALAGVGRTTVKNALREAQRQSLLRIEERRLSAWRNAPNVVTITAPEWLSWLRMRTRGVGSNPQPPRIQESKKDTSVQRNQTWAVGGQEPKRLCFDAIREARPDGRQTSRLGQGQGRAQSPHCGRLVLGGLEPLSDKLPGQARDYRFDHSGRSRT